MNPSIFAGIVVIVLMLSKIADFKLVIIFGVISVLVMLTYSIMAILKHEDITKILIYLIFGFLGIAIIMLYYFRSKVIDFNAFGLIAPILLMFFFITGYLNVKKSGNKENIKQMKIILILAMPLLILFITFFIYVLFFK